MKIQVNQIASILIDIGIPPEKQGLYLNAAAAKVIAYRLKLPAEPVVGDASDYFRTELEPLVAGALDAIVERMPIDVAATIEMTHRLWDMRYGMVHRPVGREGWAMLDLCANRSGIEPGVNFTDDALMRLCGALSEGIDDE